MEKGNKGERGGGRRAIKNSAHFLTTKIAICGKRKEGAWLPFSPVYDLCTFFFVLLHVWGNKVGSDEAKTHEFPMRKGGRPCYKARCKSWPNWCLPLLLLSSPLSPPPRPIISADRVFLSNPFRGFIGCWFGAFRVLFFFFFMNCASIGHAEKLWSELGKDWFKGMHFLNRSCKKNGELASS